MTKLEAVREILRSAGLGEAPALDTGGASNASFAERLLDEQDLEVQTDGWLFNTRTKVRLTPDIAGIIIMPAGSITIDSDDVDYYRNITQLGRRLFDLDKNTGVFTDPITVTYTIRFGFDCIPQPVQKYITRRACERYNDQYGRLERARALAVETNRAYAAAMRFDEASTDVNLVRSWASGMVRGQRIQYRR